MSDKTFENNNRIYSFDFVKCIACFCVVFIHCRDQMICGGPIASLCKWAVPFFFVISGYFFMPPQENRHKYVTRKILHIFKIIVFAAAFYFIWTLIKIRLVDYGFDLSVLFSKVAIRKFILTNTPFLYTHLWFLFALLYCYIFTLFLNIT